VCGPRSLTTTTTTDIPASALLMESTRMWLPSPRDPTRL
jgi:hypothetical protein